MELEKFANALKLHLKYLKLKVPETQSQVEGEYVWKSSDAEK